MAKCKYKSKVVFAYECADDALSDSRDGFCIFHERRKDKDIKKFNAGIEAKMQRKDYIFTGYYFPADIDFTSKKFGANASFADAQFWGDVSFNGVEFERLVWFDQAEFQSQGLFNKTKFQDYASFQETKFEAGAFFDGAEFHGQALFDEAELAEPAWFSGAKFQSTASFNGAEFRGHASFGWAEFQSPASFNGAEFQEAAFFYEAEFAQTVSFRDAHFKFQSQAEFAYRKAKISYQREGDYVEAGYYRLLEMRARRKARLERLKRSTVFKKASPFIKMAGIVWVTFVQGLETVFIDWTCGYGEEWWRVIPAALTLVFGCAFLYYFFFPITSTSPDIQITGIGWGYFKDCLYFSFVTFTTLGYGDLHPMPEVWTRAVASIEAFTGAFMMALFVLCFARKWMR